MIEGRFQEGVFKVLSSKSAVWVFLFVCLICRVEFIVFRQDFNSDKEIQIIAGQSASEGKGLRLPYASTQDLSAINYQSYYQWPRGYSAYFSAIYFLVRNVFWAAVVLDFLALLLYLISWKIMIRAWIIDDAKRRFLYSLFLILTAISNVPFIFLRSSDLISISFYIAALNLLFQIRADRKSWILFFAGLFCLTQAIYSRYAYIPIAFSICAGLILLFYKERQGVYLVRFIIGIVVLGWFTRITNHASQAPVFVNQASKTGYQLGELAKFDFLFPVQTLMAGNTIHSVSKLFLERHAILAFQVGLTLVVILLFVAAIRGVIKSYKVGLSKDNSTTVILSSCLAGGVSILLLMYLSLTRPVQKNDVLDNWTYVQEERYYAVAWVTILSTFFYTLLFGNAKLRGQIWSLFVICICIDAPYYVYSKYVEIRKDYTYFVTGERKLYFLQYPKNREDRDRIVSDYEKLETLIHELNHKNGVRPIYMSADRSERIAVVQGAVFGPREIVQDSSISTGQIQSIILKISDKDPYSNLELRAFIKRLHIAPFYSGSIGDLFVCSTTDILAKKVDLE